VVTVPEDKVRAFRPNAAPRSANSSSTALWMVAIVGALYFAREILLPFALAVLLSFLLAPLVKRLERLRVPRPVAVLVVVLLGAIGAGTLGTVVWKELYELGNRLPSYEGNITAKARAFQSHGDGVVNKIATVFDHLRSTLKTETLQPADDAEQPAPENPQSEAAPPPIRVEVVEPVSMLGIGKQILGPLGEILGSALIVVVFMIFMLLEREDLRNRFIRLIGPQQINFTTQALDAAANRVSRTLRMQLIINVIFGAIATLGLFLIGVDNPILWGVVAGLLRFVPFIGPIIGAVVPIMISLAIFDDWIRPGLVLALFVGDELLANNVLEPKLYGASTGLSPLAVVVSMVFWMWLWGPVGLILAMPLTVCLTVMGRYAPRLGFLNTLLSDEDALSPPARFYQRLLALDVDDAIDIAEDYVKENSLESLFDEVLVPVLSLSQTDRQHGNLEESKHQLVIQTVRELVEDLASRPAKAASVDAAEVVEAPANEPVAVLCLPAHDVADEVVGLMLAELLRARCVKTSVLSSTSLVSEMVSDVAKDAPAVVCVSALPPFSVMHARYLCKRMAPALGGGTTLVAGLWQPAEETSKGEQKLTQIGVSHRVSSLSEAAETIAKLVTSTKLLHCA
jgi:predicted PurR-regulated permease PerM